VIVRLNKEKSRLFVGVWGVQRDGGSNNVNQILTKKGCRGFKTTGGSRREAGGLKRKTASKWGKKS